MSRPQLAQVDDAPVAWRCHVCNASGECEDAAGAGAAFHRHYRMYHQRPRYQLTARGEAALLTVTMVAAFAVGILTGPFCWWGRC